MEKDLNKNIIFHIKILLINVRIQSSYHKFYIQMLLDI